MRYPSYLVHYNKNHDPKTGQFTFNKNNVTVKEENGTKQVIYKSEKDVFKTKNKGSFVVDSADKTATLLYDRLGRSSAEIFRSKGNIDEAIDFVNKQMDNEPYRLVLSKISTRGYDYVMYQMDVIGDKYIYTSFGDNASSYTNFTDRKKYLEMFPDA